MCEYQCVECSFTSPVSMESGMLVMCRLQYAMSLGGKYVFATVMCLVLPTCILISCSFVWCVLMALGMFMFMKGMSSLISVMSPPPCLCSLYGGVVGYFWCFGFRCEFCFLYCDDVQLGIVYYYEICTHIVLRLNKY